MNNQWFSKVAVWLVIAMVLFTVFKQFDTRGAAGAGNIGYSDFLEEVRITDIACAGGAAGVELLEHSEQHHRDDKPDGNFGKPLIVQTKLQSKARDGKMKIRAWVRSCAPF